MTTQRGWVIGRAAGAPITISPTWLIGAAILAFLFGPTASSVLPGARGGAMIASLLFVILLFGSVLLHEMAHAWVARAHGHRIISITLTGLGGVTSYEGQGSRPGSQFLISVAGPLTNFVLGGAFWLGYRALADSSLMFTTTSMVIVLLLFYAGALANAFLGIFNLIPSLPLDGGAVLESAVWKATGDRSRGTTVAAWSGRVLAVGIIVWAVVNELGRQGPFDIFSLFWGILIAWIILDGANKSLAAARQSARIAGLALSGVMRPACGIDMTTSVSQVLALTTHLGTEYAVLTDLRGAPRAFVEASHARQVPAEVQGHTASSAVSTQLAPAPPLHVGRTGADLLDDIRAGAEHAPVLVVREAATIVGLVWVSDVIRVLNT